VASTTIENGMAASITITNVHRLAGKTIGILAAAIKKQNGNNHQLPGTLSKLAAATNL
jgi:hypothetical protein